MMTNTTRMPGAKLMGFAVLAGGLAVLVGMAAYREFRAPPAPSSVATAPAAGMGEDHQRAAMTADEERFAHALWQVHSTIRTEAVRMSFTGLAYKTGEIPKEAVRDRIAPLTKIFDASIAGVSALTPPPTMEPVRQTYLEALRLYDDAAKEMVKVAADGADTHLVKAQEMTSRASTLLLAVSEKLWPGEYKPN